MFDNNHNKWYFLVGNTNGRRPQKMTHYQIWHAIELFAHAHGLSCSGLAKRSGLDPTTFNKSKRMTQYGQERWPSTCSISKILSATGSSAKDFFKFINDDPETKDSKEKC